jgi:hypothetical protein
MAPIRKNGLRRPQRGLQVRSDSAPIIGWISSPVTGPARLRIGRSCAFAPMNWKIGLMAVCCIPKLYWIPKNPRFISRICRMSISGFCRMMVVCTKAAPVVGTSPSAVTVVVVTGHLLPCGQGTPEGG